MADNVNITAGAGTVIATDQVGTDHYQKVKLTDGTVDSSTVIAAAGGVEANALRVTIASDSTGLVSVDDNAASLTVDNAALSIVGTGVEAAALRVTIATDSTGVLSVDDNGGALTVDGTVAVTNAGITSIDGKITACNTGAVVVASGTITADTELTTADLDTGAGTDTRAVVGLVGSASGGGQIIPGSSTDGLLVNLGTNNDVTITSGTVTAVTGITNALPAGDNNIGNVDIVTVPAPLSVVGTGLEATAMRVTIASDSTGVLSVDDNAGSLTVDGTVAVTNASLTSIDGKMVSGTDIGDVTINNAAGAAAVNIQDGGNAITVDGTVTASNTAGDIASDSADSGNPVKVGGKAVNMDGTTPGTAVAEADRANFITDLYGRQLVDTVHPCFWSVSANYGSAQTAVEVQPTPGAGLSLYITDVVVSNGAVAGNVKFGEDTAALVDKIEIMYFAINGGTALHFRTPIKLTANKNFGMTSVTCTTHSVTVCGYTAP